MPRADRLVALGLAAAAAIIVVLGAVVLVDLDREASLHRDVIGQLESTDRLDSLRADIVRLAHVLRLAAASVEERPAIEELAGAVQGSLAALGAGGQPAARAQDLDAASRAARLLLLQARSMARHAAGSAAALAAAAEAERHAAEAARLLEQVVDTQAAHINRRALGQIRVGQALRTSVQALLGASAVLLAMLFVLYRNAKRREARALRRIEQLAHYDGVTGLPNRTLVSDRLEQQLARAQRSGEEFAVLIFDLDGFKEVNDTRGHAAGDRLLAIIGERVGGCMRASDTVGRMGGDEFLAVLPATGREGAGLVAEKIREVVRAPVALEGGLAAVTASVGVSLFPADGTDAEALQRAADDALYEAKRRGKDRTVVAGWKPVAGAANAPA